MGVFRSNANATAAGGTTGIAVVLAFVLGALGVPLTPEVAVAGAGILISIILAIGKHGLGGILGRVWSGCKDEEGVHGTAT